MKRIVTGHDDRGRSIVLSQTAPRAHDVPGARFHELWSTSAMPAPITRTEPDPTERPVEIPPPPDGTIARILDFEPGSVSPMHRTETIDYGIVLHGRLSLLLDDGTETELEPGDVVIQRGTDHAWANRTGTSARMLLVLVDGAFEL